MTMERSIPELIERLDKVEAQALEALANLAGFEDDVKTRLSKSLTGRIGEIRDMVRKVAAKKIKSDGRQGTVYVTMGPPFSVMVFAPRPHSILDSEYKFSSSNVKTYSLEEFSGKLDAMTRNVESGDWMDALTLVRCNQHVTEESLELCWMAMKCL